MHVWPFISPWNIMNVILLYIYTGAANVGALASDSVVSTCTCTC